MAADVSRYARRRQERLAAACEQSRIAFRLFPGVTVVAPDELKPLPGLHPVPPGLAGQRSGATSARAGAGGAAAGPARVGGGAGAVGRRVTGRRRGRRGGGPATAHRLAALTSRVRGRPRRPGRGRDVAAQPVPALRLRVTAGGRGQGPGPPRCGAVPAAAVLARLLPAAAAGPPGPAVPQHPPVRVRRLARRAGGAGRVAGRAHRGTGRRRRDARARPGGLDAQPGPADHRVVPDEAAAASTGVRVRRTSPTCCSTRTSPTTTATGSGWPVRATTPGRTGGSTRSGRPSGSTRTASTSGGTCRSWPGWRAARYTGRGGWTTAVGTRRR